MSTLGVRADGDRTVVVDLERGGGDLPAIVSERAVRDRARRRRATARSRPTRARSSAAAATRCERVDPDAFVLKANPHYWAGKPAIETVRMLTTLDGRSPVDAFVGGRRRT